MPSGQEYAAGPGLRSSRRFPGQVKGSPRIEKDVRARANLIYSSCLRCDHRNIGLSKVSLSLVAVRGSSPRSVNLVNMYADRLMMGKKIAHGDVEFKAALLARFPSI